MLQTSHLQELKRRYASMYAPQEQEVGEAVLADRDYEYDGKVIKISKKNFSKVHRDFKGTTKGQETMMTYDSKEGTVLVPVQFTEEVEVAEGNSGEEVAKRMSKNKQLSRWAADVKKMKTVTRKDLNKLLPSFISGKEIAKVLDEEVEIDEGKKLYYSQDNIGSSKYSISFHDGKEKHKDGSDFYGIKLFKNKKKHDDFEKELLAKGYKERSSFGESNELQAIMALDDVGIEATINKKDQVVIKKKDLKKAEDALKKSFRKGGAPELHAEEVEIEEANEFWAVIDKAKGGEVMAISSDEKGAKSSVKMSNFSKHDYHFGKDPRTLKIVKVAGSYKKGEKMIGTKLSFKEEVEMDEAKGTAYPATIDTLRKIVKDKQNQTVMFKSGQAIVDLFTASAMVQVYDALKKPEMKKTFEKMIGDKAGFLKTQAFAMKMISGGK